MATIAADTLALQRLYHWERTAGSTVSLTQPMGGPEVVDFTWAQVGDQVRRMAAFIKARGEAEGWPADAKVALLSKNCAWWLMTDLAIWMAGYVSVPLYPTLAAETITQILTHSEARFIFIGKLDGWEGMKPGVPASLAGASYALSPDDVKKKYEGWDAICARTEPLKGEITRGADELCTLIYTSGTTGNPKGVMHNFGGFAWAVGEGLERFPMTAQDRMLSYLPLAHVAERVLVEHGWLKTGMRLYFAESLDTFTTDLQRARPTIFFSVPRLWVKFQQGVQAKMPPQKMNKLLRLPIIGGLVRKKVLKALGLDQCRIAVGGAAPMPIALLEWYDKLGLPINEGYGMTENLALSHMTLPGKNQRGTVGPAYPGVQTRIDPANGELQMRSPALMLGYYKEPGLTADALTPDGWLHTGDKVTQDADGCVRITGRVKDLFKTSKGKYVAPAPIEDKLGMNPNIEACCVAGANMGQPLGIAMLSPQGIQRASTEAEKTALMAELSKHLDDVNARLDPHEQLDTLVLIKTPWTVDNGFITPTFKVKRNRIEEAYAGKFDAWAGKRAKVQLGD
ncbi:MULTISPECIES: AMP-binding protein [unclassified Roseateles]|uniref:AMP-binding protein n=1 Tax=unclassified Roseateles TaxID=2626991 RepID=UPI0006F88D5D|nr:MULTISPECIES: AMP-binding protein [unclassified Roseateles]KQW45613.1 AMP-binding acetyl-CoA synthetase [Pelomonas sp. Root405]KRA72457.1 AMP-binding acetyl-CoA synthetase [Pelomonas sp. Root662]